MSFTNKMLHMHFILFCPLTASTSLQHNPRLLWEQGVWTLREMGLGAGGERRVSSPMEGAKWWKWNCGETQFCIFPAEGSL